MYGNSDEGSGKTSEGPCKSKDPCEGPGKTGGEAPCQTKGAGKSGCEGPGKTGQTCGKSPGESSGKGPGEGRCQIPPPGKSGCEGFGKIKDGCPGKNGGKETGAGQSKKIIK